MLLQQNRKSIDAIKDMFQNGIEDYLSPALFSTESYPEGHELPQGDKPRFFYLLHNIKKYYGK